MDILLTNDDGIFAEGIYALYRQLNKIGKVTVVAPDAERSSVGHGITLAHPIRSQTIRRQGQVFGTAVSGTPADCIKFAVSIILKKRPDMVISGINLGANDGCSIFYSGTVAGSREGCLLGIPSMAISLNTFVNPDFSFAAQCSSKLVKLFHRLGMPPATFLNINIPNKPKSKIRGIRVVRQGTYPIESAFQKRTDPNIKDYYWMTGKLPPIHRDDNSDTYALSHDYVTVSPIRIDTTDYDFLNKIESRVKLSL